MKSIFVLIHNLFYHLNIAIVFNEFLKPIHPLLKTVFEISFFKLMKCRINRLIFQCNSNFDFGSGEVN